MAKTHSQNIILSLRGSVIFPQDGINTFFLREFSQFIRKQIADTKRRFFIMVGGGSTDNYYQNAAAEVIGKVKNEDLDWLGISATKLNAHLIRTLFRDIAHPVIVEHYDLRPQLGGKRLIVCAGWQPGWTTEFDMVLLTNIFPTDFAISLSKVDRIFDRDPRKFSDAKPLSKLSWSDYLEIIGDWRDVKRSIPFDPIAAKLAQKLKQKVYVVNGNNLNNLANLLDGKNYTGTLLGGEV